MEEIWKDIPRYEGFYQASNIGRIKSLPRKVRAGNGFRLKRENILRHAVDKDGRCHVNLCVDGNAETIRVQLLVMAAFVGPCPDGKEVAHWDGNPSNNCLENLLYCTHKENISHKKRHGTEQQGEGHYRRSFTNVEVQEIRSRYIPFCPVNGGVPLAQEFGVSKMVISCLVARKTWKHI